MSLLNINFIINITSFFTGVIITAFIYSHKIKAKNKIISKYEKMILASNYEKALLDNEELSKIEI